MNPHCRIGRVKPKGNLALLPNPVADGSREICETMRRATDQILSFWPDRIAGFVMVAWSLDGCWSRGTRFHEHSPIGTTVAPAFVADILRRDVAADVTREVLRGEA